MNTTYFNEFDPHAVQWTRNLYPDFTVDERSILDVQPADLVRFNRCHFFGGIAGWEYALELARWPAGREVWSGSCPCPPFSAAGKKKPCPRCGGKSPIPCPRRTGYFICGLCEHAWFADARHLWPELWRLIRDRRPATVMGEQVASSDGRIWLAGVRASLEILGYRVRVADLCAAGVGAPHIRQRLFWLAYTNGSELGQRTQPEREQWKSLHITNRCDLSGLADLSSERRDRRVTNTSSETRRRSLENDCLAGRLADAKRAKRRAVITGDVGNGDEGWSEAASGLAACGPISGMADADGGEPSNGNLQRGGEQRQQPQDGEPGSGMGNASGEGLEKRIGIEGVRHRTGCACEGKAAQLSVDTGHWTDFSIIPCRDGKARRTQSGLFPLAYGVPFMLADGTPGHGSRAKALKGIGNAIVPQVAAAFIRAFLETES